MVLMIIFMLFIFIVLFFVRSSKTKLNVITFMISVSLIFLSIAILFYLIRRWEYYGVFSFEYVMFLFVSNFAQGYYMVVDMLNIGISLYLISMWFTGCFVNDVEKISIKNLIICAVMLLPAILYLYINSYDFCLKMYLWKNSTEDALLIKIIQNILGILNISNFVIIAFYIIFPYISLFIKNKNTKIIYRKKANYSFMMAKLIFDFFFLYYFYICYFQFRLFGFDNLLKYSRVYRNSLGNATVIITLIVFSVVCFFVFLLKRHQMVGGELLICRKRMSKNAKIYFNDARPILHTYKNNFLSASYMIKDSISAYRKQKIDIEELLEKINCVDIFLINSMNEIGRLLDVLKNKIIRFETIDLSKCTEAVFAKVYTPDNITVNNLLQGKKILCYGNAGEITNVLNNIIRNAIEAIGTDENGTVTVSTEKDKKWNYIIIRDNGCGIEKKNMSKIFDPLFSTKNTANNWGIGLSYVEQVMKMHQGMVFVDSVYGEYTEIQVQFPRINRICK